MYIIKQRAQQALRSSNARNQTTNVLVPCSVSSRMETGKEQHMELWNATGKRERAQAVVDLSLSPKRDAY